MNKANLTREEIRRINTSRASKLLVKLRAIETQKIKKGYKWVKEGKTSRLVAPDVNQVK